MTKIFYMKELMDFAIEREKEAHILYAEMAKQAKTPELESLFKKLAEEEVKHEDFYRSMLDHLGEEAQVEHQVGDEYQGYIQAMIQEARTIKPLSPKEIENIAAALDYAIAREKDSILFYVGLRNYVMPQHWAKIDEIIREESRHAGILIRVKAKMTA